MWNGSTICDGSPAEGRAQYVLKHCHKYPGVESIEDARGVVLREFPDRFIGQGFIGQGFTEPELQLFRDSGVILKHGVVPPEAIEAALATAEVRAAITNCPDAAWATESGATPELVNLARYIWPGVERILGTPTPLPTHAQIAVKKPANTPHAPGTIGSDVHIDGLHTQGNGVPKGEVHNFTLLVGVALSDVPDANSGNFVAIPGSHRALA